MHKLYQIALELAVLYFLGTWLLNWPLPNYSMC